jgi:hypothetical protein
MSLRVREGIAIKINKSCMNFVIFFGKLTYVLKEKEDTKIIRGIP